MDLSLGRELLEYPFKQPVHSGVERTQSDARPKIASKGKLQAIKLAVVGTIAGVFLLYRFFWQTRMDSCIFDLLHDWTKTINRKLNTDETFYQVMLVIAQQSIEINIFCICFISTLRVNNLFPHLVMGLFYGLRGILLNIERFPYPPNIRWDAPFIPSLTVPYGITRDYFYSGHTGLMLFSILWWRHLGYRKLYLVNLVLAPQVVVVLLATRVHYSIDIVAAMIFGAWLWRQSIKRVILFDKFWSVVYLVIEEIIKYIRNIIT